MKFFISIFTLFFILLSSTVTFSRDISIKNIIDGSIKLNSNSISRVSQNFNESCFGEGSSKRGNCKIDYDGYTFFGETKYGEPNGKGILIWEEGDLYVGDLKNGLMDGFGSYIWSNGSYYQGKIARTEGYGSTGIIYVNNKNNPSIYIGSVKTDEISIRHGRGSHYYYTPGEEHSLDSDPVTIIDATFENNIAKGDCVITDSNGSVGGKCNGLSPTNENFKQANIDVEKFFVAIENIDKKATDSYLKALEISNEAYEIAQNEKLFETLPTNEEIEIVSDNTNKNYDLEPIEDTYIAIKNANIRSKPFVGSEIVDTILKGSEIYVPGKIKNEKWLLIEKDNKFIGYSFEDLYLSKTEYTLQQQLIDDRLNDIAENILNKEPEFFGSGTGFYINNEGYIVTNHHVTNGCEYILLGDEKLKVLHNDIVNDLSVIKSSNLPKSYLRISEKIIPIKGENIKVIGYPFGKFTSTESKVTAGIVSALQGLANNISHFQIDAAIQPGNSGGPVFDDNGALVGVTVATADYKFYEENFKALPQNMNFAIKSMILENFLASNSISYDKKNNLVGQTQTEIVKFIDNATVYIECWSTEARFEEAERGVNILVEAVRAQKASAN